MSQELYVFLNRSDMPTPAQWQQAITRSGFDLHLDQDFDPILHTGFLPCDLAERQTGFEFYFWPKEEIAGPQTYLAAPTHAFDSVVVFVWGTSLTEMSAVLIAAASLASQTQSLLHNPEDDSSLHPAEALGYARQQLAAIQPYLKQLTPGDAS